MIKGSSRTLKDSGVGWLGDIPESWDVKPFWTLYRREKSTGYPDEELLSVYRDYGVIPKSSRDDNGNVESEDLNAYQLVDVDDLVMNKMKAWQGSIAVSDIRGIVSPAYFVFKPRHKAHGPFLHHLLRSKKYIGEYNRLSKGIRVGQWDLEPIAFRTTPVILPPYEEQVEIASFLDRETAQIDALMSKQEKLIDALAEREKAIIASAVTRGINIDVPLKDSGIEWLGHIPEHWVVSNVKRAYGLTLGKMLNAGSLSDGVPMPYLRAGNIQEDGIDLSEVKTMVFTASEAASLSLEAGDVVVVEGGGGYGRSDFLNETLDGWAFQNHVIRARPAKAHLGKFFDYYVKFLRGIGHFEKLSSFATIPNVSAEKLGSIEFPIVSLEEQLEIADYLDGQISSMRSLKAKANSFIDLLKERRQALISAAVTGKIDVRGK